MSDAPHYSEEKEAQVSPNQGEAEAAPSFIKKNFSSDDLFSDLGDTLAETRRFTLLGREFWIKTLSSGESLQVVTKAMRTENGQVIRAPEAEARNGVKYRIHKAVVRGQNDTNPLFALADVDRLLDHPKAKSLVDKLIDAVHDVNPELDPSKNSASPS